ncbi:MAG: helix-turn-helix domain-containing protein [Planctomycetia bacterium]|nr:MAG: helix-turn-helix domain-containing protein [Planctomycetia bacterium]
MAKPFYTMDEVAALLKKSPDEIKALVRDGKLREFRDAGKLFFKAEDVTKLAGPGKGDTGELTLDAADDELPTIASSGNTSVIGLETVPRPGGKSKEDTAVPGGIGVFDDDELEVDADPMAKTTITSAARDQVSLEGTGSGSGLLDLTREADDTSLGAELLDEIYPGQEQEEAAAPVARSAPPPAAEEVSADQGEAIAPPQYIQVGDPAEGLFGGMLVAGMVMMAVAGFAVAGAMQGFVPGFIESIAGSLMMLLLIPVGVLGVSVLVGWLIGRATSTRRAA